MRKFLLKIVLSAMAVMAGVGVLAPIVASADEGVVESVEETASESVVEGVESVVTSETDNVSSEVETSENTDIIVEETETSKWFDETLKPLLLQFGAEIAAFAVVGWMWLKKFGKAKDAFGNAVGLLTQSNTDNTDTAKAVEALKAEYEKEMAALKAEMAKEMADLRAEFVKMLQDIKETVADKVSNANETLNNLLEVEKMAYGDNAALVSSGTAKRIAEVVNHAKTKNKNTK